VGEYIEDTEEYINIELDAGRNRLIRLDIVLTAASFALAPFNLMAGLAGMARGGGGSEGELACLASACSLAGRSTMCQVCTGQAAARALAPPPPHPLHPGPLMPGILGENLVIPPLLTASVNKFWVVNATALLL
jgi:hypothetical protein